MEQFGEFAILTVWSETDLLILPNVFPQMVVKVNRVEAENVLNKEGK